MDTGIWGAQEGEGSLQGKRHLWLWSPGIGQGNGSPSLLLPHPPAAPLWGSPAVLPWQLRPRLFTPFLECCSAPAAQTRGGPGASVGNFAL